MKISMASGSMKLGRKGRSGKSADSGLHKRGFAAVIAHRTFAPLVGLWGAALGGSAVMVMPASLIEAAIRGTPITAYDLPVQAIMACGTALATGLITFALAAAKSAGARSNPDQGFQDDTDAPRVRPIDPARDLGTNSLDDPLDAMPFTTPAWRDADDDEAESESLPLPRFMSPSFDEPGSFPEPADEANTRTTTGDANAPRELDLSEFGALPGRNAVWVEEPAVPAPAAAAVEVPIHLSAPQALEPARAAASRRRAETLSPPLPGTAALARLREMPTSELSIVEMVERFAGALHEHRATTPVRMLSAAEFAAREAVLADALRALAALSGADIQSAAADVDEPLRSALSQLQPRRGAA